METHLSLDLGRYPSHSMALLKLYWELDLYILEWYSREFGESIYSGSESYVLQAIPAWCEIVISRVLMCA